MPDAQAITTTVSIGKKLDGARALRALILRHRDQTDEARQLAQPVVEALARSAVTGSLPVNLTGGSRPSGDPQVKEAASALPGGAA